MCHVKQDWNFGGGKDVPLKEGQSCFPGVTLRAAGVHTWLLFLGKGCEVLVQSERREVA